MSKDILKENTEICTTIKKIQDGLIDEPVLKEYKFTICETWEVTRTFTAASKEEAYDMATEYQNEYDMDLTEANYIDGNVSLSDVALIKE